MAGRPKSICRSPGCGKLIDLPGYCEAHKKQSSGWYATSKLSASERGYGNDWRKLRKSVMDRDNGMCQLCLKRGVVTLATEVDHIKPKSLGGSDEPANLRAICRACHATKTAHDRMNNKRK